MTQLTNCGLYPPGRALHGTSVTNGSVPVVFIPAGNTNATNPPFSNSPPRNESRWYCKQQINTCENPAPGTPKFSKSQSTCIECVKVGNSWLPNNELCQYLTDSECYENCADNKCVSIPVGGGGTTTGGGGGIPGSVVTSNTKPPWKCVTTPELCEIDVRRNYPIPARVRSYSRKCEKCNNSDRVGTDPNGNPIYSQDCRFQDERSCVVSPCNSTGPITGACLDSNIKQRSYGEIDDTPTNNQQSQSINFDKPLNELRISQPKNISVSLNTQNSLNSIISNLPAKKKNVVNLSRTSLNLFSSPSSTINNPAGILDPVYNFFNLDANEKTTLVSNFKYTNIFNSVISDDVKYFLDNENSSRPWNEKHLFNLTLDKIAISINPILLNSFNNIHYSGNTKVSINLFLIAIKNLLLSGNISQFDPNYYIKLADDQKQFMETVFSESLGYEESKQAALGLVSMGFSSADFMSYRDNYIKNQIKRERRLNTDIEAKINIKQFEKTNLDYLNLDDAGMKVFEFEEPTNDFVELGDGAGYYFSAVDINKVSKPLPSINEVSNAYYVPPDVRYNALNLLSINPGITLIADSSSNYNEFTSSYDYSKDLSPMYFAINLENITTTRSLDTLITTTEATYVLLTDEQANEHVKNYGLNVSKINIDFNDPLIHYAKDTSTITIRQQDITFKSFSNNRTNVGNYILTRNIPLGIILTPGNGSIHNPFFTKSVITSYDLPTIRREINLIPNFVRNELESYRLLSDSKLYDISGTFYFGDYEKYFYQDTENILYSYTDSFNIFNNSYYTGEGYTSIQLDLNYRKRSPESSLVNLVDNLISSYNVEFLTWWDVYRRMKLNDIGNLMNVNSYPLRELLTNNWRGIPINQVASRSVLITTGINQNLLQSDVTIINESDRLNA